MYLLGSLKEQPGVGETALIHLFSLSVPFPHCAFTDQMEIAILLWCVRSRSMVPRGLYAFGIFEITQ